MGSATSTDAISEGATSESMTLEATPWSRFWARILDIHIEISILSIVLGFIVPGVFAGEIFKGRAGDYLIGFLLLPFVLLLDAAIQALFGQTVGKAVAGIRVETMAHARLTFGQALRRNAEMYIRGMILGIPLITIIGFWNSYKDLKAGRLTSWDRDLSTRVFAKRHKVVRTALTAALVVIWMLAGAALNIALSANS